MLVLLKYIFAVGLAGIDAKMGHKKMIYMTQNGLGLPGDYIFFVVEENGKKMS